MKLFFYIFTFLLLMYSSAIADWSQTFRDHYETKGIDTAVSTSLGEGINPDQIKQQGLLIEVLPSPELIKALFCSLVQPAIISDAAKVNNLPESTVAEGYQLALAQCAEEMEEQMNIAPNMPFPGANPAGQIRPAQASPWTFK